MNPKKTCSHPTCENECRREPKPKKVYQIKRSPLKKKAFCGYSKTASKELSLPDLLAMAQAQFNLMIRLRDRDKGCICCGGPVEHAGHFYPQGTFSGVRLDELNVNGCCETCNVYLDGNLDAYIKGIVVRYGLQASMDLTDKALSTRFYKWSKGELLQIIQDCKAKVSRLNKQ